MTDADKRTNPVHFGSDTVDTRIRINPEIRIRIPDHFWLRQKRSRGQVHLALEEVCALRVLSSYFWTATKIIIVVSIQAAFEHFDSLVDHKYRKSTDTNHMHVCAINSVSMSKDSKISNTDEQPLKI